MPKPIKEQLSAMDKITILLSEYSTLRTEILTRTTHMFQIISIGAALIVWEIGHALDLHFVVMLIVGGVFGGSVGWLIARDIKKAATRLRELEKDINDRAGEELLVWETVWGGDQTGYVGTAKPKWMSDRISKEEAEVKQIASQITTGS